MICTANRCLQGHKDCTRAACGFHLSTEEGGESADTALFMPHEPATWAEIALHFLIGALALFCLVMFVLNVARAVL